MNSYRLVLFGTVIVAVLLVLVLLVASTAGATDLISFVIVAEALADIAATAYVLRLVLGDTRRPRSWLLLTILTSTALTTLGVLPLAYTVARRYLGQPPLPSGLGLLIVGMGLIVVGVTPAMKAVLFFLVNADERRARTRSMRRRSTDVPEATDRAELLAVPFVHRVVRMESAAIGSRVNAIRKAEQTERLVDAARERLGRR